MRLSGGTLSVSIKAGTNKYREALYRYNQNTVTGANQCSESPCQRTLQQCDTLRSIPLQVVTGSLQADQAVVPDLPQSREKRRVIVFIRIQRHYPLIRVGHVQMP